ncbi:MAG: ABC transporter ATP-binding protein [Prevotellaceae bacterium]|nr:ABC transporter ATP-binding protein [Prevotellaceae bacterium]
MELRCENLSKSYGKKEALHELSLTLTDGIYGILGPNGAGKSTLMNLLTDNLLPSGGRILWKGRDIHELGAAYRRVVGYMPQQQGFYEHFTAAMFLHYMAELKGLSRKEAREETARLLALVHLADHADEKLRTFSGGMRQRVLLAQALLGQPKLLILDEPTAGLDPYERINFRNLLSTVSQQCIVLLSTHVVSDVECIADQILLLQNGKLVASGEPASLIRSARGHVFSRPCEKAELTVLQAQYPQGVVMQQEGGLTFRVTAKCAPEGFAPVTEGLTLEDVYLLSFDKGA